MDSFPNIRIEVEGLKREVIAGFMDYEKEIEKFTCQVISASMDSLVNGGLQVTLEDVIQKAFREIVYEEMKDAIRESVREYFEDGDGKSFLTNAVDSFLDKTEK